MRSLWFVRGLGCLLSGFLLTGISLAENAPPKKPKKVSPWPTVVRKFEGVVLRSMAADLEGEHLLLQKFTTEGKQWAVYSVSSGEKVQSFEGFEGWSPATRKQPTGWGGEYYPCYCPMSDCSLKKIDGRWTAYEMRSDGPFYWEATKRAWQKDAEFKTPTPKETRLKEFRYRRGEKYAVCTEQKTTGNAREKRETRLVVFDPKTGKRVFQTFWGYEWKVARIASDGEYLFAKCGDIFIEDPEGPDGQYRGDWGTVRGWRLGVGQTGYHVWKTSRMEGTKLGHIKTMPQTGSARSIGMSMKDFNEGGYMRTIVYPQVFYLPRSQQFVANIRYISGDADEAGYPVYGARPWKKLRDLKHMHECRLLGVLDNRDIVVGVSDFRFVFWDVNTGKSKALENPTNDTDPGKFEGFCRSNRLFCAHANGTVKVWGYRDRPKAAPKAPK